MAITYLQQPVTDSIQASDTPIVYVFSSNQTTQPNFSFVVDTLYNGIVVQTDMVFPERGNRAHFDAGKVALPNTRVTPRATALVNLSALGTVQIRVAERYGTTPVIQPWSASNICKVLKASCPNPQYALNWVSDKYEPSVKWLTDAPGVNTYVSRKHPLYASILNIDDDVLIEAYGYDVDDNAISIVTSGAITGNDKVDVMLTPAMLTAGLVPGNTLQDVVRLEVYMNQSEALRFTYVDEECGTFNQLNWRNNVGGFDQFLFTHNREDSSAISALEYKKQFGAWDTNNVFQFDDTSTGDTTYLKTVQPSGTLFSGWISEAYQNWLNEIYFSVDVLMYSMNGSASVLEKITVTDTKATISQARFEDVLNFEVGFKKSTFKTITQ